MMIDSPWNLTPAPAAALGSMSNKRQIEKAVAGFESVLMREWLRAARQTSLSGEEPSGAAGYLEMADDQLAGLVSRNGGLGLSRGLADQILKQVAAAGVIAGADSAVKRVEMKEVAGE